MLWLGGTDESMLLELCGIRRVYPEFALEASFAVSQGEFFSILGPSGSGKTTLLRLIAGFDRPDGGRLLLAGQDITRLPPHRRRIGMVFQDYALFPHLSVGENVAYGLKMQGLPPGPRRQKTEELLVLVGLAGFYHRDPSSLSGGEQQRVALARALAPDPLVLLFDEPFSALDQSLRQHLRREIRDLQRQTGFTALFVTHSQEEALSLSDRMLVMSRGRVEQVGRPDELYRWPGTAYVAGFLGEMNRLPVRINEGGRRIGLDGLVFPVPPDRVWPEGPGFLCFRPEEGRIAADPGEGPWLPVTVIGREFAGPTIRLQVRGGDWNAVILQLSAEEPAVLPNQTAWLRLPLERASLAGECASRDPLTPTESS